MEYEEFLKMMVGRKGLPKAEQGRETDQRDLANQPVYEQGRDKTGSCCAYKMNDACDITEMEAKGKNELGRKIEEWHKNLDCGFLSKEAVYRDGYFYLRCNKKG